ncbi:MAG: hypothetical protein AAGA54_33800 [Myxococcota bacterium]
MLEDPEHFVVVDDDREAIAASLASTPEGDANLLRDDDVYALSRRGRGLQRRDSLDAP